MKSRHFLHERFEICHFNLKSLTITYPKKNSNATVLLKQFLAEISLSNLNTTSTQV